MSDVRRDALEEAAKLARLYGDLIVEDAILALAKEGK